MSIFKKPIVTGPGWNPGPGLPEYEVRKLLEDEFRQFSRGARRNIESQHDLWRYLFSRLLDLKSTVEQLEARVRQLEAREQRKC